MPSFHPDQDHVVNRDSDDGLGSTRATHLNAVEDYYEETWGEYRAVWMNSGNRALHFGYWDGEVRSHSESLNRMNQIMATAASIGPDSHVLDAGCGVGGSAMWLAEHLGTHVQGLTISTDQSIRARRYVRQRSLDHLVEVSQGDFLHTEYSDGSFDVAWAQESLVHEPDKRAFFAEIHRVLKPGGRLVIEDWFAERPAVTNREIKVLDAWTAGCAVSPLISVEHLLNIARPSGFRVVEQINLEPFVRRSVMRLFQTSLLLYPLMFVLYKRGIRSPAQHKHLLGAFHAHEAFYRNLWSVHLIVLEKP